MNELCHSDAAYVLGALSPADRREYEDHLRTCADCQASVGRLAGMPGLLSLIATGTDDSAQPMPASLLPGLTGRVQRYRRRRRMVIGGVMAASFAVMIALLGSLLFRTPSAPTETATVDVQTEQMTQLVPGPMQASLELVDKKWGTAITVICQYDQDIDTAVSYDLTVIGTDGQSADGGTWRAVAGATSRVVTATSVHREDIAALEVQLPDGKTILRADR